MDLQTLIAECRSVGCGDLLYAEVTLMVHAVVRGHRYPTSYSPTGVWDEDAISGLAHDWLVHKLLGRGQLEHLLLINQTLQGFRKGLELSFVDFLIGQRKRTALDNLFERAGKLLENDTRFTLFVKSRKKASRFWGLVDWQDRAPFQGAEEELIAAGLRQQGVRVIQYRGDARKQSPVVSDHDLGELLAALLEDLDQLLSLAQFTTVFAYRFNLLDATPLSTEQTILDDGGGPALTLGDTLRAPEPAVDVALLVEEALGDVLPLLSDRQRRALLACSQPGGTLVAVAEQLGCSKSTVENELRRAERIILEHADGAAEAQRLYARLLEHLAARL
jgi:hypothetical protein